VDLPQKMHDFSLLMRATVELPGLIFYCGDRNRGAIFPAIHVEIMPFYFSLTISLVLLFILYRVYLFWDPGLNSVDEVFVLAKTSI
jgi:hypothetical protein